MTRRWTVNLGPEALDQGAIRMNAERVGQFIHHTLAFEGWPFKQRSIEAPPGAA